jgi:putative colanic acid biosynthesis glycosyltransferase
MAIRTLTIITISYCDPVGLLATLKSVAGQSRLDNLEHLVIDGGSAYDVRAMCAMFPHISKVISEPDKGIYDAMNKGIDIASGEYMLFLNSGDELADSLVVDSVISCIKRSGAIFYFGDGYQKQENGERCHRRAASISYVKFGMFALHQSMVFEANRMRRVRFDEKFEVGGDYNHVCRFIATGVEPVRLDFAVCVYAPQGVSSRRWLTGVIENFRTRRCELGTGLFSNSLIAGVQILANVVRIVAPGLYFAVRPRR